MTAQRGEPAQGQGGGLTTRLVQPVVKTEEWVFYHQGQAVEVARWLVERGARPEIKFSATGEPELWFFAGHGPQKFDPGKWLSVVNEGASIHTRNTSALDNPDRYRTLDSEGACTCPDHMRDRP